MIQAQVDLVEKAFSASDDCFEKLKERLSSGVTKAMTHSDVERMLATEGRELLRCMLDDHLSLRKVEEQAAPALRVVGKDGIRRVHHRDTERGLASVFGEVGVGRIGFGARGCSSLFPLDAALNLPRDHYSFELRKLVAIESARGSFDEAVAAIARTTGSVVPKRQVEELARRAAMDFDRFYEVRKALAAKELAAASNILALTLDGKGIVVREEDLRPATRKAAQKKRHKMTKRLSPGEKKYRKRMAMVAAVYTVDVHHRTAEEIAYGPESVEVGRRPRPRPEAKRVWASIEKDPEKVVREIFAEALRRDPNKLRKWVALSDGNETQLSLLEKIAGEHGIELTIVVDIIHVLEYLWDATTAFNPTASAEAEEWVTERLFHVLNGKSSDVAGGMRRSATLRKLSDKDRLAVDDCADYLLKYHDHLRYDSYLAQGLPIATGVIEGACRHLIADRMDITGARWSLAGAEAVLRLRSLRSSGDFDEYWAFHEKQEHARNHLALYQDGMVPTQGSSRRSHLRAVP